MMRVGLIDEEVLIALGARMLVEVRDENEVLTGYDVEPDIDLDELAAAQANVEALRLAAVQREARERIIAFADRATSPILSRYPEAERAGWHKREAEARSVIAAQDKAAAIAATSVIRALAEATGESTAATVARAEAIATKADEFAAISAAVEIMRDQALAAIEAVTDPADMPAVLDALKAQATALAAEFGLA